MPAPVANKTDVRAMVSALVGPGNGVADDLERSADEHPGGRQPNRTGPNLSVLPAEPAGSQLDHSWSTAVHDRHRVSGGPTPLGWASGIHDPALPIPKELGLVRMSVCDESAIGEQRNESVVSALSWSTVVDDSDAESLLLDDQELWQGAFRLRVVHVALRAHDRRELLQHVQDGESHQISRMNDEVCAAEDLHAPGWELARAARHVRVSENRDHRSHPYAGLVPPSASLATAGSTD